MFKSQFFVMLLSMSFMGLFATSTNALAKNDFKLKPGIYVSLVFQNRLPHAFDIKSKYLCAVRIKDDHMKDGLDFYYVENPMFPGLCGHAGVDGKGEFGPYPVGAIRTSNTSFVRKSCDHKNGTDFSKCSHYVLYKEL